MKGRKQSSLKQHLINMNAAQHVEQQNNSSNHRRKHTVVKEADIARNDDRVPVVETVEFAPVPVESIETNDDVYVPVDLTQMPVNQQVMRRRRNREMVDEEIQVNPYMDLPRREMSICQLETESWVDAIAEGRPVLSYVEEVNELNEREKQLRYLNRIFNEMGIPNLHEVRQLHISMSDDVRLSTKRMSPTYVFSRLLTGVLSIEERPNEGKPFVEFVDGRKLELPTIRDGKTWEVERITPHIVIIHVFNISPFRFR